MYSFYHKFIDHNYKNQMSFQNNFVTGKNKTDENKHILKK